MFNTIISPMLLQEVDTPFQNNNYLYELKYDGIRALIYASKKTLKVITRNGKVVTNLYPELQSIKNIVGTHEVIFDGEIVAFQNNKPSFSVLQKRSHLKNKNKINNIKEEIPICFIAFDILYQDKELVELPLIKRKEILNKFKDNDTFIKTKYYNNGIELFNKVKKLNLEGIVAKEKNSIYIPDKRVSFWLKIKNFQVGNFYIHGYIKNKDKYSLLLGEYHNNKLHYIGKVSVMPNNPIIKEILKEKKIKNQFTNIDEEGIYIEPKHKIKVHYIEKTEDNILRQPFIKK